MFAPTPFGVMLKESRENAKLSQFDLASGLGKTAQYISNIEKGKTTPLPTTMRYLSSFPCSVSKAVMPKNSDSLLMPTEECSPELFRYVFECPPLVGLINFAVSNSIPNDYWDSVFNGLLNERKAD